MIVAEMRQHVENLIEEHGIVFNIVCRRPTEAWALSSGAKCNPRRH